MVKVYAIGGESGLIKLGKSKEPERRLRDLQPASPVKLSVLGESDETEAINEKDLHKVFAGQRSHYEWFDIDQEVVKIVFSGDDRIGQIMKMSPRQLGRLIKAYGAPDMQVCIKSVVESTDWFWGLACAWSKRSASYRKPSRKPQKRLPSARKTSGKKIGRPPAGKDKRERRGILTASDAEWKKLKRNAKKAGYESAIVWLRELGLRQ